MPDMSAPNSSGADNSGTEKGYNITLEITGDTAYGAALNLSDLCEDKELGEVSNITENTEKNSTSLSLKFDNKESADKFLNEAASSDSQKGVAFDVKKTETNEALGHKGANDKQIMDPKSEAAPQPKPQANPQPKPQANPQPKPKGGGEEKNDSQKEDNSFSGIWLKVMEELMNKKSNDSQKNSQNNPTSATANSSGGNASASASASSSSTQPEFGAPNGTADGPSSMISEPSDMVVPKNEPKCRVRIEGDLQSLENISSDPGMPENSKVSSEIQDNNNGSSSMEITFDSEKDAAQFLSKAAGQNDFDVYNAQYPEVGQIAQATDGQLQSHDKDANPIVVNGDSESFKQGTPSENQRSMNM